MSASAASSSSASSSTKAPRFSQQPGRFHARPMPPRKRQRSEANDDGDDANEETKSISAAKHAVVPRRVYLHRHALESVFAFLRLRELSTALAVSRDWQAAVGSMRSSSLNLWVDSEKLLQVVSSGLRRHVTAIRFESAYAPSPETTALLHYRMPHLTRLETGGHMTIDSGMTAMRWPTSLQELTLTTNTVSAETNMLLRSISQLSQLRTLNLNLRFSVRLSFAPLSRLLLLRHLTLAWTGIILYTDDHMDEFRALADIDTFDLPLDKELLMRLLGRPHSLRWRLLSIPDHMDDDACALLPSLSCLTTLTMDFPDCSRFAFLPRLQSLSQLSIDLGYSDCSAAAAASRSLVDALQHCPRITSLALCVRFMPITCEELATCLAAMPALSRLQITHAKLKSLSFLAVPSLAQSLHQLVLHGFRDPKPAVTEMRHLHGLKSLRELSLQDALDAPLDKYCRSLFRAPSLILPALERFTYRHNGADLSDDMSVSSSSASSSSSSSSSSSDDDDDDDESNASS